MAPVAMIAYSVLVRLVTSLVIQYIKQWVLVEAMKTYNTGSIAINKIQLFCCFAIV